MSVGIGVIGREVTYTFGGAVVTGRQTKSLELSNTRGETGDESSNGYTEALAKALEKSGGLTIEGLVKNYELFASWFTSESQIFPVVFTFPDGSTLSWDFFLDSLSSGMPYNEMSTFSMSLSSSGTPNWTSGT
ncbi:MAG: phage tail tube protein [Glaciecola sp.]|jgi:predicted secreted protein